MESRHLNYYLEDFKMLQAFGCTSFLLILSTWSKLMNMSKECVFLGYCLDQKRYKCLDIDSHQIYISRHVRFLESNFPYWKSPILKRPKSTMNNDIKFGSLTNKMVNSFSMINKPLVVLAKTNLSGTKRVD